jgi:hypothetical protein
MYITREKLAKCASQDERIFKTYVYKLLLLALILCTARLVLEDHVVVPAALHVEVLLVEKRVSESNVSFSGFFLFFESLCFL